MLVTETVSISEQITENILGALLEIGDKFITKLNVFSYIILQFRLTSLENLWRHYMNLKNTVAR